MRKAIQQVAKGNGYSQSEKKKGVIQGIIFGLVPHTFCILFVVLYRGRGHRDDFVETTAVPTLFFPDHCSSGLCVCHDIVRLLSEA